jgi:hypothetical protein
MEPPEFSDKYLAGFDFWGVNIVEVELFVINITIII